VHVYVQTVCADLNQELAVRHQKQDGVADSGPGIVANSYTTRHLVAAC